MSSGRTIELRLKSVHATVKQLSALIEKTGNGNSLESWKKAGSKDQTCSHFATAFDALIMAQKIITYVTDENETLITKESEYKAETHHLIDTQSQLKDKCDKLENEKKKLEEERRDEKISTSDIKGVIKEMLPTVVREATEYRIKESPLKKTYADAIKKTELAIVKKAESTFDNTLQKALAQNQKMILQSNNERADVEDCRRRSRARNIVISGIPESKSTDTQNRIDHDKDSIAECGIPKDQIVKCWRAGKKETEASILAKPLVVILTTPSKANEYHNYGVGQKVSHGVWINPDLTRLEREAAYKARQANRSKKRPSDELKEDQIPDLGEDGEADRENFQ